MNQHDEVELSALGMGMFFLCVILRVSISLAALKSVGTMESCEWCMGVTLKFWLLVTTYKASNLCRKMVPYPKCTVFNPHLPPHQKISCGGHIPGNKRVHV